MTEEMERLLRVLTGRKLISFDDEDFIRGIMSEAEWCSIPFDKEGDEK